MSKPLSLADRIKQQKIQKQGKITEKDLIDSIKTEKTGSGLGQVNKGSGSGLDKVNKRSSQGQQKVKSRSGLGQVSSIRSRSGLVSKTEKNEITLAPQQEKIYQWFLENGFSGYYNKGIIHRETHVSTPTIRKCIHRLIDINLINIENYNPISKQQKYKIKTDKKVKILSGSGLVSGLGQVNKGSTSNKKERKIIFKKLSVYIENSTFWKSQGLTIQKCQSWIDDINHCDEDFLLIQLQFAENITKVKNADNPINYFYKTIIKDCFTRPTNFLFPGEQAEKIKEKELKEKEKFLSTELKNKEKEKELADKESFLMFLKDKKTIDETIKEIKKQYTTPKMTTSIKNYKTNGKIDTRLETALKRLFFTD